MWYCLCFVILCRFSFLVSISVFWGVMFSFCVMRLVEIIGLVMIRLMSCGRWEWLCWFVVWCLSWVWVVRRWLCFLRFVVVVFLKFCRIVRSCVMWFGVCWWLILIVLSLIFKGGRCVLVRFFCFNSEVVSCCLSFVWCWRIWSWFYVLSVMVVFRIGGSLVVVCRILNYLFRCVFLF